MSEDYTDIQPIMEKLIRQSKLGNKSKLDWSIESVDPFLEGDLVIEVARSNKGVIVPIHAIIEGERYVCRVVVFYTGEPFPSSSKLKLMGKEIKKVYDKFGLIGCFSHKNGVFDSSNDEDVVNIEKSLPNGGGLENSKNGNGKFYTEGSDLKTLKNVIENSDACILRMLRAIDNSGYDFNTHKVSVGRVLEEEFGNSARQYVRIISALDRMGFLCEKSRVLLPILTEKGRRELIRLSKEDCFVSAEAA